MLTGPLLPALTTVKALIHMTCRELFVPNYRLAGNLTFNDFISHSTIQPFTRVSELALFLHCTVCTDDAERIVECCSSFDFDLLSIIVLSMKLDGMAFVPLSVETGQSFK